MGNQGWYSGILPSVGRTTDKFKTNRKIESYVDMFQCGGVALEAHHEKVGVARELGIAVLCWCVALSKWTKWEAKFDAGPNVPKAKAIPLRNVVAIKISLHQAQRSSASKKGIYKRPYRRKQSPKFCSFLSQYKKN